MTIFLYTKDYTNEGFDRYFIYTNGELSETTAKVISTIEEPLICHDYWLICQSIQQASGKLPSSIYDVEEIRLSISGSRIIRKGRESQSLATSISSILKENVELTDYLDIFNGKKPFNEETYAYAASVIEKYWDALVNQAIHSEEMNRQLEIELPVFNYLWQSIAKGINISPKNLEEHKKDLNHNYYMTLKEFSEKHNMPLEVPTDGAIIEHLEPLGFNFEIDSVDYILNFTPSPDGFAEDCLNLRKIAESRRVLSALPLSTKRIFPILDTFGTITSRIYFKDPALQSLPKKYRDIIAPDDGLTFSYIDYDQFEVGIMAALSNDEKLLKLYSEDDIYTHISKEVFNSNEMRGFSKKLFLSFTYGMKFDAIIDAAFAQGADRNSAKTFFRQFSKLQEWKSSIQKEFEETGKICTSEGNHLKRERTGSLSEKEKRSCVSQVVQGTASLIFKKAILLTKSIKDIEIKLTMHDAALIQHTPDFDTSKLIACFTSAFTDHFSNGISGKASLESFFVEPRPAKKV